MIKITPATVPDIPAIRLLAEDIWFPTYQPILSPGQVKYMFSKFYSAEALSDQMEQGGHSFLLAYYNDTPSGFASYSLIDNSTVKLHKLYILPGLQGKGIGAALTDSVAGAARTKGADKLILYVNKYNYPAQRFYEKKGLRIIREEVNDIGEGYVMDDFVLELIL